MLHNASSPTSPSHQSSENPYEKHFVVRQQQQQQHVILLDDTLTFNYTNLQYLKLDGGIISVRSAVYIC